MWDYQIIPITADQPDLVQINETDFRYGVNLDKDPFTALFIDEQFVPESENLKLEEGIHYISVVFKSNRYDKKVNVNKDKQEIKVRLGGTAKVTSASEITFTPSDPTDPEANLVKSKGSTYEFNGMLGRYILKGKPKGIHFRTVQKKVAIDPRSHSVFRLDEMIPYIFILYHGTTTQPLGVNMAYCKNFGWFSSYTTDLRSEIETPYGETAFFDDESEKTSKVTSLTISSGPMCRLWRKLYMQLGAGWVYYLSTSQPKILTADYKYKSGISVNVDLFFKFKSLVLGAGFHHQFVKKPYNPDMVDQFSFRLALLLVINIILIIIQKLYKDILI